ncbi:MAG: LysM peptidoglycan-binding domain-containing protein [Cecembia sp.]
MKDLKILILGKLLIPTLLITFSHLAVAQGPVVPKEISFADLTIRITEQARREIQLDVDALHKNKTYFDNKAERANLYFPFVERELREAGIPEDFKYLVLQESSLIPDAVSSSNAVGFWQFKQGTAEEVFLRVDNQVDERKNIVASSRGAALYLKKNNNQFDNWMCALVSYQMGLGGARAYFGSQFNGKKIIDVDRNSHWYFKKFLAHKVAFENHTGAAFVSNVGYLEETKIQGPTTIREVSRRLGVSEEQLMEFNKWAIKGEIPGDKSYSVLFLRQGTPPSRPIVAQKNTPPPVQQSQISSQGFPRISGNLQNANSPNQIKVNNINGIKAEKTTSQANFAEKTGMKVNRFRKFNDLDRNEPVVAGQYYYLDKKAPKAEVANHVVMPGENLWSISQKYGIRLAALKAKNRIRSDDELNPGMILSLQENRKRGEEFVMVSGQEYRKMLEALTAGTKDEVKPASVPEPTRPQEAPTQAQPSVTTAPTQPTTPIPQAAQTQPVPTRTEPSPATRVPEPVREEAREIVSSVEPVRTPIAPLAKTHRVEPGETLFRLSQIYQVSVEDLRKWNNLSDNTIRVGQEVIVSDGSAPAATAPSQPSTTQPAVSQPSRTQPTAPPAQQSGTIIHVVAAGETLFRLSQNYSVSVDDIKRWNNLSDNTIQVGQEIRIIKP